MNNFTFRLFFFSILLGFFLPACAAPASTIQSVSEVTAVTPTLLPASTATATALPTSTATVTPLPTATTTPSPPPTVTHTPTTASSPTPSPTATSSLPSNPLPLTGGAYNGCPLLEPGLYTTNPYGCDSSSCRMDLAQWTMGKNLSQVTAAYEQNGDIHLILSNGQDINLNALNYRVLLEINSLSRAIETWDDSITDIDLDQMQMFSIVGLGTTVGYFEYTDIGTKGLIVAAICGE